MKVQGYSDVLRHHSCAPAGFEPAAFCSGDRSATSLGVAAVRTDTRLVGLIWHLTCNNHPLIYSGVRSRPLSELRAS